MVALAITTISIYWSTFTSAHRVALLLSLIPAVDCAAHLPTNPIRVGARRMATWRWRVFNLLIDHTERCRRRACGLLFRAAATSRGTDDAVGNR